MLLPDWGEAGKLRLKSSSVFIAGVGGLVSAAASYIAAASVGETAVCDADRGEASNLNRQILHRDSSIGECKPFSAGRTLRDLNPGVRVPAHAERFDGDMAFHSSTGGHRHAGAVMLLHPPEAPCLRCLLPERPQVGTRDIGDHRDRVRAGWVHSGEALKHLTGLGASLLGTLLVIDAEAMLFERIRLNADPPVRSVADARPFPAGEAAAPGPRPGGPVEIRCAAARPGCARLYWIPDSVSNGQRLDRREAGARHHTRPTPSAPSPSFALAVCAPPKATQTSSMRLLQPSPRTPAPDCASPARVASASCSSPHRNLQRRARRGARVRPPCHRHPLGRPQSIVTDADGLLTPWPTPPHSPAFCAPCASGLHATVRRYPRAPLLTSVSTR